LEKVINKKDDIDRLIEMAWEDRTPLDAIKKEFRITEGQIIRLMRNSLKPGSFKAWRKRLSGRRTKHLALRNGSIKRSYCRAQYKQPSK
jgi:uncharacterized protein (TIGR03643 family)